MYGLKRDPSFISKLVEIKGDKIYCKERCIIEYPVYYNNKEMGLEGEETQFYGIFALIVGDRYSVSVIPTMCVTEPVDIGEIDRDGVLYRQLHFGKGDCIISSKKVLALSLKAYNFFESYFMRGNVPWYVGYHDLVKCMDNLLVYADSGIGGNLLSNELLVSYVTRSVHDKDVYYRQLGGQGELSHVGLFNIHSLRGPVRLLAGGYMNDAITSALVRPSSKDTKLELHMKE